MKQGQTENQEKRFKNIVIFPALTPLARYRLCYSALLTAVPLACGLVLLMLVSIFSQLNLYFLEANGLPLDEKIRDAYFKQVELEIFSTTGYFALQIVVTAIAAYMVMRWATAPFVNAQTMVRTAIDQPEKLRPASSWLSESPAFDRVIWLFCLRLKGGGPNQVKELIPFGTNFPFLAKFLLTFGTLSLSTGYVLSIIMDSVYRRVVELAVHLVNSGKMGSHYFLAQQQILQDANTLTTSLAMLIYFFLGLKISRYMAVMIFVFSRAIKEDSFPLTLRATDLYGSFAKTLNEARQKTP